MDEHQAIGGDFSIPVCKAGHLTVVNSVYSMPSSLIFRHSVVRLIPSRWAALFMAENRKQDFVAFLFGLCQARNNIQWTMGKREHRNTQQMAAPRRLMITSTPFRTISSARGMASSSPWVSKKI
jgi:hypothetical protein